MKHNRFREVVSAGKIPVGHMIMEFGTRGIAKILESADIDFVVYDMEHSGLEVDRLFDLLAWSKASPFTPMVRVPVGEYHFLARSMDAGALGVMVGNVQTPEQAEGIVASVKYAPLGKRGVALGTAHSDYLLPVAEEYLRQTNESGVVICQIESEIGVANSEAIAAVPGVDCLWVGHYDLSTNLGIPGQFQSERFLNALRSTVLAGRKHGKLLGIQPGSPEQAEQWIAMGFNVISWSCDIAVYSAALKSAVTNVRQRCEAELLSRSARRNLAVSSS
jgi:2-dehydro-3-deoxyglucarate aldolase/4-hydroxy-2-oxoheptanedioate aldolase